MKICIYGAGSIGGLIGGVLADAGHEVGLIARGAHLDAMRREGLTVETGGRTISVRPAATDAPADLGVQEVVVVAVKAPALPSVAAGIGPLLGSETVVMTAMNGIPWWFFDGFPEAGPEISYGALDPGGALARPVPTDRVIGCVVHLGALVPAPGHIRHVADNRLILGEAAGGMSDRLAALVEIFAATPLDATATGDLRQEIWLKLLGNFNFAPVSSLTGATNGTLGSDPGLRKLCVDLFEEAAEAGRRIGLAPGMTADARIDMGASLGDFRTSMLQDFDKGRPPEIDAIVGAVAAVGRATGVPMPCTEAVLALVCAKARGMGLY